MTELEGDRTRRDETRRDDDRRGDASASLHHGRLGWAMGYGLGYRASRWTRRASHRIQSFHHSGVNRTRLSVVANTRASASRAFGNPTMSCSPAVSSYRPTYRAPSIVRSLGRSVSRLENLSASPGRSLSSSGRSTTTYSSRATTRDVERCAVDAVVARASRASPGSRGGAGMIASTTAERDETKTTTGR